MVKEKSQKTKIHNLPFGGFWVDPKDIVLSEKGQKIIEQIAKIPVEKQKTKAED